MSDTLLFHIDGQGIRSVLFRAARGRDQTLISRRARGVGWNAASVAVPRADLFATRAEAADEFRRRRTARRADR